jgi:hypothetical protein
MVWLFLTGLARSGALVILCAVIARAALMAAGAG